MEAFTATLDKVLHLATLVATDLARFERESELTTSRTHLLWTLGAAGPSTQQSLATALGVSARNVTGLVDGLAASGHVSRERPDSYETHCSTSCPSIAHWSVGSSAGPTFLVMPRRSANRASWPRCSGC